MENENTLLKLQNEKLKRECLEKHAEIEALIQQNQILRENQNKNPNKTRVQDQPDILFQAESPFQETSSILNTFRKPTMTARDLLFKGTENTLRIESMKKLFCGEFDYKESPFSLVDINKWEFVIVCPNPDNCDLRDRIGIEDAKKYFRKSFRPQFSKNLKTLGENNLIEFKAFETLLMNLNSASRTEKMFKYGGRFFNDAYDSSKVIDSQAAPKDYLTLMRNALLVKLGYHLGLHTKQVLSGNGKYIYILVCADEEILKNEAESDNYNLQIEIGEIDLPSLEPVDDNLRPLRIVQHVNGDVIRLLNEFKEKYADILDYFKISENDENKYEAKGINSEMMITYHQYLAFFMQGLEGIRKKEFKSSNTKVFLQKLIQNSIVNANRNKKKEHQIMNMWSRLGFDKPISPYLDYFRKVDPETGKCKYDHMWKIYETQSQHIKSIFSSIDRIKLLTSLIKRQVNIEYLAQKEIINSFFPLKNSFDLNGERTYTGALEDQTNQDLLKTSIKDSMGDTFYSPSQKGILNNWKSKIYDKKIPLTKVRNYFGEKIGFYFAFISYYSKILSLPSLIGAVVFVLQRIYEPDSSEIVIINLLFCIYISVWATVFIEFWKRKENSLAIRWGQTDFKEDEVPRPQFRGVTRRSPVDDELDDVYFDPSWRYKYYVFSMFVTGIFIGIVVVIVLFLILLRTEITNTLIFQGFDLGGPLVSSINAFQIQVFNLIFNKVAVKLTNLENHRTQSEYENSLILKTYVFQFVNSFFSLFYIAFFKTNFEGCMVWNNNNSRKDRVKGGNCVDELYIQFITIFSISFFRKVFEIAKPFFQALQKSQEFKKVRQEESLFPTDMNKIRDQIDSQFSLPLYLNREVDGTLGDYLQIAVLFGYITLFAVAFPLSGFLAFISVVAEIQVDRYKLLYLVKRPVPLGAKDISTWKFIFIFNSIASIVTNAALICFALPTFDNYPLAKDNRYLIFSIFCLILLCVRVAVSMIIPDIPLKYDVISKRHSKIAQRFIKGWEVSDSKQQSNQVYVNPEIYGTISETPYG